MIYIRILLGGMTGGVADLIPPTNTGMFALRNMLSDLPNVDVQTWTWGNWREVAIDLDGTLPKDKIVVIGYSGGGSRATDLANWMFLNTHVHIDLMVLYDPSPADQMQTIRANVKRAICYRNLSPKMWFPGVGKLGGGVLRSVGAAPVVETVEIAQQHLLVQGNMDLHKRTIAAVEALK
jgi:hypothetical protein